MKKICIIIAQISCAAFLFAAESGVSVGIRYYDKRLYYPETGDILVQITITNNSSEAYRFRLSDDRAFSLDFDVRTLANRKVEDADILVRKRTRRQRVFFREVSLDPGESLSFVENIREWRRLDKPGSYIMQAKFYPDLFNAENADTGENQGFESLAGLTGETRGGAEAFVSNRLNLHIRAPEILSSDGIPVALEEETQAVFYREHIPPDEVVLWTLQSRQRSQWEKFFLYLDLEQMLLRDAARGRSWRAASEEGRRRMLAAYRENLNKQVIDGDISAIPFEFTIERTTYNSDEGTVVALEKFKTGDYTELKRYTYYLRRTGDIWLIVDYVVQNLGTE
ncbi:MAG: hypothetical protein LBF80_03335 [Spirochaetaceae bacterium]|jgi:hypothetical protein|nr:hypothetical protein [Spirochaetaceae bacterium]